MTHAATEYAPEQSHTLLLVRNKKCPPAFAAAITHSLANGASILNLEALTDNAVDYNPLTRL